MRALVPKSKSLISTTKSTISKKNTPTIPLSQTSVQESTTKDKASNRYWNDLSKEKSERLWLPTKIGGLDSVSVSSNGYLSSTTPYWNLWESTAEKERILLPTYLKSLQYSQPDIMVGGDIVTRKLRLFLNPTQKSLFRLCCGTHRYFYNKAIEEINRRYHTRLNEFKNSRTCIEPKCKNPKNGSSFHCLAHKDSEIEWKLNITQSSIRSAVMHSDSDLTRSEKWQGSVPFDTRQLAIWDAIKAYTSAMALKKTTGNAFELHYKKRSSRETFCVDHRALKKKKIGKSIWWCIFSDRLKKDKYLWFSSHDFTFLRRKRVENDLRVLYDRGSWYLLFTYKRKSKTVQTKESVVSLDPGVRTFMTSYSPDGSVAKFGEQQIQQLRSLHSKIDYVRQSKDKIVKGYTFYTTSNKCYYDRLRKRQRGLRLKEQRLNKKVYDTTSNLHNQVSAYLTNNFSDVLLPHFNTSKMEMSDKLDSYTKRMMNTLGFYKFKMKLIDQCRAKNRNLYLVDESYTTRTCGSCGYDHATIGSNKTYTCPVCHYKLDRDVHGARNILIRFLSQKIQGV